MLGLHHSTACKAEELTATIQPGLRHTAMKWFFLASESLLGKGTMTHKSRLIKSVEILDHCAFACACRRKEYDFWSVWCLGGIHPLSDQSMLLARSQRFACRAQKK